MRNHGRCSLFAIILFLALCASALTSSANPAQEALERDAPVVFKDMGVVQNKAMNKGGRFLFAPAFSFDFSDGPYTMYSVGARIGYALSDFWEVYLVANPKFIANKRGFFSSLERITANNNIDLDLEGSIAQGEYGIQLLWAPLYGKDSLGISRILRSETFLRFGASRIAYDGAFGVKLGLGIGKTFFLSKWAGLRAIVETSLTQTIYSGVKEFTPITYVESGLVFYL